MRIVFLSNYFNHHQKPLSDSLYKLTEEFKFVAASRMREERVKLGYTEPEAPYVVHLDDDSALFNTRELIDSADAVIIGSAPEELIQNRIREGKTIFRYCERPMKRKPGWRFLPELIRWRKRNPGNADIFLLCSGAYTSADFARFGLFRDRAFKWGYFPELKRYDDTDALIRGKKKASLLWVGRFLEWKHPEIALNAAAMLKNNGYSFSLKMIGIGELEPKLRQMTGDLGLGDSVTFAGSMPPESVRACMEESKIFLFTSDRQEGWGAVLNEAMNSGCVAIASQSAGASPYLIKDGENGFLVSGCDPTDYYRHIASLLDDSKRRERIAVNAYDTIESLWNAEVAARRLTELIAHISGGGGNELFSDGPCSKAEILKDS